MNANRRLFITVAKGSILFTIGCWAVVLMLAFQGHTIFDGPVSTPVATTGVTLAVIVPDALAAWWIFRKLLTDRPQNDARRGAIGFAVSAPLVLGIGNVLGMLIGGWAGRLLGSRFILPTLGAFVITLMVLVPSGIVMWLLHPSGGVDAIAEGNRK